MTNAFNILAKAVLTAVLPYNGDILNPLLQVMKSIPVRSREMAGPTFTCFLVQLDLGI